MSNRKALWRGWRNGFAKSAWSERKVELKGLNRLPVVEVQPEGMSLVRQVAKHIRFATDRDYNCLATDPGVGSAESPLDSSGQRAACRVADLAVPYVVFRDLDLFGYGFVQLSHPLSFSGVA